MLSCHKETIRLEHMMTRPFLELSEAANLTVQFLRVYDDPT